MSLTFPKPPTPPTPPTIDKGDGEHSSAKIDAPNFFQIPFVRDPVNETYEQADEENFSEEVGEEENFEEVEKPAPKTKQVTTPETLARDAVANGAGPLTKRTVTRPEDQNPDTSKLIQIPSDTGNLSMSDAERGKAILREFEEEDRQNQNLNTTTDKVRVSTETPSKNFQSNILQVEGHGGFFWLLTLVFVGVLSFVFVNKYLIKDKPKLRKSDLFDDSSAKLKAAADKVTKKSETPIQITTSETPTYSKPKPTPVKIPKKNDEDKGGHFEVRV